MIEDFLEQAERRRAADAARFAALDPDTCMLCDAHGQDKRSLFIDCLYAIEEAIPEIISLKGVEPPPARGEGYYLLICKSCRGRLLGCLRGWADECRELRGLPKDHDGELENDDPARNIPVRVDGATVMMTEPQYYAWRERRDAG